MGDRYASDQQRQQTLPSRLPTGPGRRVPVRVPGRDRGIVRGERAGKTTLLKCILGLLRCSGTITLDGEPITGKNIARLSFATCEHSFFPGLTAEDHRVFCRAYFPAFRDKRFQA